MGVKVRGEVKERVKVKVRVTGRERERGRGRGNVRVRRRVRRGVKGRGSANLIAAQMDELVREEARRLAGCRGRATSDLLHEVLDAIEGFVVGEVEGHGAVCCGAELWVPHAPAYIHGCGWRWGGMCGRQYCFQICPTHHEPA